MGFWKIMIMMNLIIIMLINFMFSLLLLVILFVYLFVIMFICFNILVWNVCGIMLLFFSLLNVLDIVNCDIVIICEYKFKLISVNYLDIINLKYLSFVYIDLEYSCNNIDKFYFFFVGKGGVGIMYRKDLLYIVLEIFDIIFFCIIGIEVKCKY